MNKSGPMLMLLLFVASEFVSVRASVARSESKCHLRKFVKNTNTDIQEDRANFALFDYPTVGRTGAPSGVAARPT